MGLAMKKNLHENVTPIPTPTFVVTHVPDVDIGKFPTLIATPIVYTKGNVTIKYHRL
jgi:hypothetical protein